VVLGAGLAKGWSVALTAFRGWVVKGELKATPFAVSGFGVKEGGGGFLQTSLLDFRKLLVGIASHDFLLAPDVLSHFLMTEGDLLAWLAILSMSTPAS